MNFTILPKRIYDIIVFCCKSYLYFGLSFKAEPFIFLQCSDCGFVAEQRLNIFSHGAVHAFCFFLLLQINVRVFIVVAQRSLYFTKFLRQFYTFSLVIQTSLQRCIFCRAVTVFCCFRTVTPPPSYGQHIEYRLHSREELI